MSVARRACYDPCLDCTSSAAALGVMRVSTCLCLDSTDIGNSHPNNKHVQALPPTTRTWSPCYSRTRLHSSRSELVARQAVRQPPAGAAGANTCLDHVPFLRPSLPLAHFTHRRPTPPPWHVSRSRQTQPEELLLTPNPHRPPPQPRDARLGGSHSATISRIPKTRGRAPAAQLAASRGAPTAATKTSPPPTGGAPRTWGTGRRYHSALVPRVGEGMDRCPRGDHYRVKVVGDVAVAGEEACHGGRVEGGHVRSRDGVLVPGVRAVCGVDAAVAVGRAQVVQYSFVAAIATVSVKGGGTGRRNVSQARQTGQRKGEVHNSCSGGTPRRVSSDKLSARRVAMEVMSTIRSVRGQLSPRGHGVAASGDGGPAQMYLTKVPVVPPRDRQVIGATQVHSTGARGDIPFIL